MGIYRLAIYYFRYLYFLIYVYWFKIKIEKKEDKNKTFFIKYREKLKEILENPEKYNDFNSNFEKNLYEFEDTNKKEELIKKIEEKWNKNSIFLNTPRGNVFMSYDIYRNSFVYYSDSFMPNYILNAVAIKYIMTFKCLDFYVNEEDLENYNNKYLDELKKYNDLNKEKNEKILKHPNVFLKKQKKIEKKKNESKDKETNSEKNIDYFKNKFNYKGKISNYQLLNKEIIYPTNFKSPFLEDSSLNSEINRMSYKDFKKISTE